MSSCTRRAVIAFTVLLASCGTTALAQFDVNGPNAALTINNVVPSSVDPLGHQIPVGVPGSLEIRLTSGVNPSVPFILLAGTAVTPVTFSTASLWSGSIDLGTANPNPPFLPNGIVILIDSIANTVASPFAAFSFTPFVLSFGISATFAGVPAPGLQAIIADPTVMGPIQLDNTEAGQPVFQAFTVTTYDNLGDDVAVLHQLNQAGGPAPVNISYGGVAYTQMNIGSNGQITFAVGDGGFFPNLGEFFAGWQGGPPTVSPNPGVAVAWQDMARGTVVNDAIVVTEDRSANIVTVAYLNQEHWDSLLPSGSFSVTFGATGPNTVAFDLTGFIVGNPSVDAGPVVGCSDGNDGIGSDRMSDLSVDIGGGYLTTSAPESIGEDFNSTVTMGGSLDVTQFTFFDIGNGVGTPYFTWLLM